MRLRSIKNAFKVEILIEGSNLEYALSKLKRNNIAMFSVRKVNKKGILMRVYYKDLSKVFAFFDNSCYNIKKVYPVESYSLFSALYKKIPLFIGLAAFLLLVNLSNGFILKCEVVGGGAYYRREVKDILSENGIGRFSHIKSADTTKINASILSLKDVSYSSISLRGYVLRVEIQVTHAPKGAEIKDLISDRDGVIEDIILVCGETSLNIGDEVRAGETLLKAEQNGERCVPIASFTLVCEDGFSAENLSEAQIKLKAKHLFGEDIIDLLIIDGAVKITYRCAVSINLN